MSQPFPPDRLAAGALEPLAANDAAWVAAMLAGRDPWRRLGYSAAALEAYLTRPDPALARLLLRCDDDPAGIVCLRHPWLRGPYLELFAITRPGRGLGSAAMDWMAARAALVAANLWATVSEVNLPARAFYQRHGFVEVTPLDGLVADGHAEILLRRRVRA